MRGRREACIEDVAGACGVNYGVAAFSIKLVTSEFGAGPTRVFTNWPIYMLAITGPAGFILNQNAFQEGKFLAPVQAIITTADPVISIALGILWLDARLRGGPAAIFGEVAALLLMTVGIVVTARHSPQVAARPEPAPATESAADARPGRELSTYKVPNSRRQAANARSGAAGGCW
jgi:hypothetical protein